MAFGSKIIGKISDWSRAPRHQARRSKDFAADETPDHSGRSFAQTASDLAPIPLPHTFHPQLWKADQLYYAYTRARLIASNSKGVLKHDRDPDISFYFSSHHLDKKKRFTESAF